jgi:hypothetical protein
MKFIVQKIDGEIRHDFAFTLLESIRYRNWLRRNTGDEIVVEYNYTNGEKDSPIYFKSSHKDCVPIGSVEFVKAHLMQFYGLEPKPINIPNELLGEQFMKRFVFNGTEKEVVGEKFVKSNDTIKGFAEFVDDMVDVPEGNYQISDVISIDSEWRAFVYRKKLIGLQNYSGDFTLFPNPEVIKDMIDAYKSAPISYTLDVAVQRIGDYHKNTVVIEVHDFFSCGLYGFNDNYLANMFYLWYREYLKKNGILL